MTAATHPHCGACWHHSGTQEFPHDHTPVDQVYTFAIAYPTPADPQGTCGFWYEEIDVAARSSETARELAQRLTDAVYEPGYDHIEALPVGGSGGWFQVLS